MQTKVVNVRLPEPLLKQIQRVMKSEGYSSPQEFIKEATRMHLQQKVLSLYGSQQNISGLSKQQRAKLLNTL